MENGSALGVISDLCRTSVGVFRGRAAVKLDVSRKQLNALVALGAALDAEPFEIAYEDARRRRLTSVPRCGRTSTSFRAGRARRRSARCSASSTRSMRRARRWR
jgi:hypothetical protein